MEHQEMKEDHCPHSQQHDIQTEPPPQKSRQKSQLRWLREGLGALRPWHALMFFLSGGNLLSKTSWTKVVYDVLEGRLSLGVTKDKRLQKIFGTLWPQQLQLIA
jgi:hypothetical protein